MFLWDRLRLTVQNRGGIRLGKGRKITIRAFLLILVNFIVLNVVWYVWRMVKYDPYSKGMKKNVFSTWIVPRYTYSDADRFDYGVKYPDYLSFTGNLSVGLPTTDEDVFTDFLIIWPGVFRGYQYGVSISEGDEDLQIYINADGSAVFPEDSDVVIRNQETINTLLSRAEEMWDLE